MSSLALNTDMFPIFSNHVRAKCAAILYRPLLGSPETLVIGIIAANDASYKVVAANSLSRLSCLYGSYASVALSAAEAAIELSGAQLAAHGAQYLDNRTPFLSNVTIGDPWEAEGKSLEMICHNWLTSLSSLHDGKIFPSNIQVLKDILEGAPVVASSERTKPADKLPSLVMEFVKQQRAEYIKYFSAEVRGDARPRRGRSHEVVIHYAGPKLVANFGTLRVSNLSASVTQIKRHLWDLKVDRDKDPAHSEFTRPHEMFVQRPALDDPQVTDKQQRGVESALAGLEAQADQEKIRLRPLTNIGDIGRELVAAELGPRRLS